MTTTDTTGVQVGDPDPWTGVQVGDPDPWTGDQACCPLPAWGTHRWGDPTDTTKETDR